MSSQEHRPQLSGGLVPVAFALLLGSLVGAFIGLVACQPADDVNARTRHLTLVDAA